ncbi:Hypothetical predicted protein, partial [Cloeon dipterum]
RFGGARSEPCEVTSGVIQGSVLGPLLFNIYVSDLPAALKTNLVQYADDCTVFKVVSCQDDVDELQDDLALVDIWCTNNGMQLNAKKCVAMDISRARQPWTPQYTIGGVALDYVCTQRLLGVHISRDLRWNHHVDVQQSEKDGVPDPREAQIVPAWHPWTKANIGKMARTQNKALHFIYGRHVPPPQNMKMLSVPAQLVYNDLLLFKKSLCGLTDYNAMARIIVGRVHRGDDPQHPRLQQPPARTELGQCVFDYRVVAFWNAAPPALKDCSAAQFPAKCKAPASNGVAERAVQTAKQFLKKTDNLKWPAKLDSFILGHNATPNTRTGVAPAEFNLGHRPHTVLDKLHPSAVAMRKKVERDRKAAAAVARLPKIEKDQRVVFRNFQPRGPKWQAGPLKKIFGPRRVMIEEDKNKVVLQRHTDQVKPVGKGQINRPVETREVLDSNLNSPAARPSRIRKPPDRLRF